MDTGNAAGLASALAVSTATLVAAAVGSLTSPAFSINSSNSSTSKNSDIIGGGDSPPSSPSGENYEFPADGDAADDDNMPTDAEASKYLFLNHLEHYIERALISEDNCKAVELVVMVEAGTTVREMDPMKKEVKEKAFLNSYV